jgi:hypothetical protein
MGANRARPLLSKPGVAAQSRTQRRTLDQNRLWKDEAWQGSEKIADDRKSRQQALDNTDFGAASATAQDSLPCAPPVVSPH